MAHELLLSTNIIFGRRKKKQQLFFGYKHCTWQKPIYWTENMEIQFWIVTMEHMMHTETVINQSNNYAVDERAIKYTLPNQNSTSFLFCVCSFVFVFMCVCVSCVQWTFWINAYLKFN